MAGPRVPLYERLPEIYRTRDEELQPPGQLRAFLALVERAFGAIHADIESLYDDLFVETAADWAVSYIGDLLGTSHLTGDPWTLRADVADTIALRRRKGTLGAIELLTFNLTRWGVRAVELRENLLWQQHLNHQRPDRGGLPAYGPPGPGRAAPIRGGTVTLRDPALLSLLGTPFDPFAHTPDVKPHTDAAIRYNLPNLAIFLWRLEAYRVRVSPPGTRVVQPVGGAGPGQAAFAVRVEVHPLDRPVRLFNVRRGGAAKRLDPSETASLTEPDQAPGPIHLARLTDDTPAGNPAAYVAVETYDPLNLFDPLDITEAGLQLHLPEAEFAGDAWQFRGANLCAWEAGLDRPLADREVAIDPVVGRLLVGVAAQAEAEAVRDGLLLTYTYGAVGPVGAHPVSRLALPRGLAEGTFDRISVSFAANRSGLQDALENVQTATRPRVIEIGDSMVHDLDLGAVSGTVVEDGEPNLALSESLVIRATSGNRPIIRLARPLRLRPVQVVVADAEAQRALNSHIDNLFLRLEGLHLVRGPGFPAGEPLIARAALGSLEIEGCTLDPGGFRRRDGTRAPVETAVALTAGHGFALPAEATAFDQTPAVRLRRTVSGPLLLDPDYTLDVTDSIVDAGRGVSDAPDDAFAVSAATGPVNGWGAPMTFSGATFLGRVRVEQIDGRGGIFVHALEAHNNQRGCIRYSYVSGAGDRLPQNHACVDGTEARLRFTDEWFGDPAYGQLALTADVRIRERGPGDDEMGAFTFLQEAHKWRNLQIRFREFMPLGVRPLLIPVT